MQKWLIVCIAGMLWTVGNVSAQEGSYQERARKYIEQFRDLAVEEQRRSGVPAAITLAQGVHETSAGSSELAINANNHFGIKCKKEWTGEKYAYTDDAPNECFRKYPTAIDSYKDHSDYLLRNKRYAGLFELPITDYKGWATGLKRCGYATNPKYAQILIKIVEDYNLQDYTLAALEPVKDTVTETLIVKETPAVLTPEVPVPTAPTKQAPAVPAAVPTTQEPVLASAAPIPALPTTRKNKIEVSYEGTAAATPEKQPDATLLRENPSTPVYDEIVRVNDLKAFYARKGTVLLNDAIKHNIRYAKLLELNDLPDAPLEADMYIYLEKKHTTGNTMTYVVQPGETLLQIAQKEGIQLKYLKAYNKIGGNEEPVPGSVLQLIEYAPKKPATYARSSAPAPKKPIIAAPPVANVAIAEMSASEQTPAQPAEPEMALTAAEPVVEAEPMKETEAPVAAPEEQLEEPTEQATEVAQAIDTEEAYVAMLTTTEAPVGAEAEDNTPMTDPIAVEPAAVEEEQASIIPIPEEDVREMPAITKQLEEMIPSILEEIKTEGPEAASEEPLLASINIPEPITTEAAAENTPVVETAEAPAIAETPAPAEEVPLAIETTETAATPAPVVQESAPVAEIQGPQDEFTKLKARLDRVVYSSDQISTPESVSAAPTKANETKSTPVKGASTATSGESRFYTVKKGDTAFSIARKHNLTMKELRELNDLEFQAIRPGQKLRVK